MTALLDLDALKAKALAATPGEWHSTAQTSGSSFVYVYEATQKSLGAVTSVQNMPKFIASEMSAADAAHAAAASPATMLELLARLETAEAEAAHYRGVANDVRRQQLGTAPIVDPTKGRYNCAGDYVMPKPFYDPSLQVPAEILAAANMVSTWAAKQNRGSWRIGDVCSADFGGSQLARLRSGNAILRQQAEALHAIGHAIGVPAGDDVTKAVLPAVKALTERAARAETIANSVLESITSQPNTVMVMKAAQAENVVGLAHELARIIPSKSTVIALQDGATLEQLDQDDMRRHGWVRAEGGAQ